MITDQCFLIFLSQQWIPRYGFKKVQAEKEKNWVREVPDNVDPYEDQFAKAANLKKENIAKNEFQRLRNIARNSNVKLPSVGVTGNKFARPKDVRALNVVSPLVYNVDCVYIGSTLNVVWDSQFLLWLVHQI